MFFFLPFVFILLLLLVDKDSITSQCNITGFCSLNPHCIWQIQISASLFPTKTRLWCEDHPKIRWFFFFFFFIYRNLCSRWTRFTEIKHWTYFLEKIHRTDVNSSFVYCCFFWLNNYTFCCVFWTGQNVTSESKAYNYNPLIIMSSGPLIWIKWLVRRWHKVENSIYWGQYIYFLVQI